MKCNTHHHACDCREEKVAALVRAAWSVLNDHHILKGIVSRDAMAELGMAIQDINGEKPKEFL